MALYRKRPPVEVDAVQWGPDEPHPDWLPTPILTAEEVGPAPFHPGDVLLLDKGRLLIVTHSEGVMFVQPGDWIIRGVNGELYPCDRDIFAATYEAVT